MGANVKVLACAESLVKMYPGLFVKQTEDVNIQLNKNYKGRKLL